MKAIKIKICGLSTTEHALAAATAGADLVGLVFAPSRRQVSPEQARTISAALRQHPVGKQVGIVGLFVNTPPDQINWLIENCDLDYVQLSGDELPKQAAGIQRPIMKTLRLRETADEQSWLQAAAAAQPYRTTNNDAVTMITTSGGIVQLAACPWIIDAHVAGSYGGTGTLADLPRAARFARQQPMILAGGLAPDNVAAAVEQVRPWGVDVSSGVETAGQKDTARIGAFIAAARSV